MHYSDEITLTLSHEKNLRFILSDLNEVDWNLKKKLPCDV